MNKKIIILETAASYYGKKSGGSYLQAHYYEKLLKNKGFGTTLIINSAKLNRISRFIWIISSVYHADYVIGFGTLLLDIYLQWLCFIFGKKGIFCIDTIIVPLEIINDHLKRKLYKKRFFISSFIQYIINILLAKIPPPKINLINISSCQYVKDKLIKTAFYPNKNKFLNPTVEIKKRRNKKIAKNKKVLFYGALYRGRGVIDLLKACRLLWQKGYRFKLMILGWPVELLTLRTLQREIRVKEKVNIILKEKVDNIRRNIENSSVVVLPFRYPCSFQTPYTLLEPMGLGVPVITTDVGSHGEWIKDGETGLICEKENPQDIADKIELVLTDYNLVDKITEGAMSLLKERYAKKDILVDILGKFQKNLIISLFGFLIIYNAFDVVFDYFSAAILS